MLKIYRPRWAQCDDNTLHDPLGLVKVDPCAFSVVCKSLTLTLERCTRGVYSVPSERMGTLGIFPGTTGIGTPCLSMHVVYCMFF